MTNVIKAGEIIGDAQVSQFKRDASCMIAISTKLQLFNSRPSQKNLFELFSMRHSGIETTQVSFIKL